MTNEGAFRSSASSGRKRSRGRWSDFGELTALPRSRRITVIGGCGEQDAQPSSPAMRPGRVWAQILHDGGDRAIVKGGGSLSIFSMSVTKVKYTLFLFSRNHAFDDVIAAHNCVSADMRMFGDYDRSQIRASPSMLLVQPKKGFVPTLVRLERIDQFYRFRANELFYSLPGLFVSGLILANRERNVPLLFDSDTGTMHFCELIGEVIQSAAQIDDNISSRRKSEEANVISEKRPWQLFSGTYLHVDSGEITVLSKQPR